MATMINGQLILEEEYDENYQPTEQGKWNFNFAVFVMCLRLSSSKVLAIEIKLGIFF